MWTVDSLWPATTAVIGVYDHPAPPEVEDIITSTPILDGPGTNDFFTREGVRTAELLTRAKDYLGSLLP